MSIDLQNGFAMLLWSSKVTTKGASVPAETTECASTGGSRSFKSLGQKRPHAEVEGLPPSVMFSVDKFEEFLTRAQFALTSKEKNDTDKVIVNLTAHQQASSLKTGCLPKVTLHVLLSRYTFKLASEKDIHKLHTGKEWMLEFRSVREDDTWKYNPKFRVNVVVVLYEKLSGVTQKFLNANDEFGRTDNQYWSLDPKDTYGLPTADSMKNAIFCAEKDRECMRFVSMRLNNTTPGGHGAHGLAAATSTIGAVPMSIFRGQIRFPPPGFMYVVGFELPSSVPVKRALASKQDCMLCSDTYTTRTDKGMITTCGHYMCQTCWDTPAYKKGIEAMRKCAICREPCALMPGPETDAPPEAGPAQGAAWTLAPNDVPVFGSAPRAGGSYSSYGVGGVQGRPYAQSEPPALEYHASLTDLLKRNGFAGNGLPEMFIRVLGP
jgi:hypothetical protein